MGLAKVGVKGTGLGARSKGGKSIRSFVLRTYIVVVGEGGERELHID